MSFFKDLFNGRLYPIETSIPDSEEYNKLFQESIRQGDLLREKLTEQQEVLLDKYLEIRIKVQGLLQEEIFRQAFILGMEMKSETELSVKK